MGGLQATECMFSKGMWEGVKFTGRIPVWLCEVLSPAISSTQLQYKYKNKQKQSNNQQKRKSGVGKSTRRRKRKKRTVGHWSLPLSLL